MDQLIPLKILTKSRIEYLDNALDQNDYIKIISFLCHSFKKNELDEFRSKLVKISSGEGRHNNGIYFLTLYNICADNYKLIECKNNHTDIFVKEIDFKKCDFDRQHTKYLNINSQGLMSYIIGKLYQYVPHFVPVYDFFNNESSSYICSKKETDSIKGYIRFLQIKLLDDFPDLKNYSMQFQNKDYQHYDNTSIINIFEKEIKNYENDMEHINKLDDINNLNEEDRNLLHSLRNVTKTDIKEKYPDLDSDKILEVVHKFYYKGQTKEQYLHDYNNKKSMLQKFKEEQEELIKRLNIDTSQDTYQKMIPYIDKYKEKAFAIFNQMVSSIKIQQLLIDYLLMRYHNIYLIDRNIENWLVDVIKIKNGIPDNKIIYNGIDLSTIENIRYNIDGIVLNVKIRFRISENEEHIILLKPTDFEQTQGFFEINIKHKNLLITPSQYLGEFVYSKEFKNTYKIYLKSEYIINGELANRYYMFRDYLRNDFSGHYGSIFKIYLGPNAEELKYEDNLRYDNVEFKEKLLQYYNESEQDKNKYDGMDNLLPLVMYIYNKDIMPHFSFETNNNLEINIPNKMIGGSQQYYQKYVKYKNKYIKLKTKQ